MVSQTAVAQALDPTSVWAVIAVRARRSDTGAMFEQELQVAAENKLKASESKKLRRRVQLEFPATSDEQLDELWPSSEQVMVQRLADKTMIYSICGRPTFYTVHRRACGGNPAEKGPDRLRPSVYALHVVPGMLPAVEVYPGLQQKLASGADLFMPGVASTEVLPGKSWVLENFGRFEKGDLRALVEAGAWAPFAVASWAVSSTDLEYQGLKGKGFNVEHQIGDVLWSLGHGRIAAAPPASAARAAGKIAAKREAEMAAQAHEEMLQQQRRKEADDVAFVESAPKTLKKYQKMLRQIAELHAKFSTADAPPPNADQLQKMARKQEVSELIAAIELRLARLRGPAVSGEPDQVGSDGSGSGTSGAESTERSLLEPGPQKVSGNFSVATNAGPGGADFAQLGSRSTTCPDGALGPANLSEAGEINSAGSSTARIIAAAPSCEPAAFHVDGDETIVTGAVPASSGETTGDAAPESVLTMDEVLELAFVLALCTTATNSELPMLVSKFYSQHMLPASHAVARAIDGAPELKVKQTRYKKIGVFLEAMAKNGSIAVITEKAGVQKVVSVDRTHSNLIGFNVDRFAVPDPDNSAGADFAVAGHDNPGNLWQGAVPKRGTKLVTIHQKKVRGNKNVTVIENLSNFGIRLDDPMRKELAKHFSSSVTFSESADKTKGTVVILQGKYVIQLEKYIKDRYKLPGKYIRIASTKGVSAKDKNINV